MPQHIAAIDQGTTSTRFIVFDGAGRTVACAQKEHRQIYPQPGWVEHDAEEIWRSTEEVIAEAMEQAGLKAADVAAVGNPNSSHIGCLQPGLLHRFSNHLFRASPDFFGVVLYPSRLRINLAMLLLRAGHRPARAIKHNEARACGSLINGGNVLWHPLS